MLVDASGDCFEADGAFSFGVRLKTRPLASMTVTLASDPPGFLDAYAPSDADERALTTTLRTFAIEPRAYNATKQVRVLRELQEAAAVRCAPRTQTDGRRRPNRCLSLTRFRSRATPRVRTLRAARCARGCTRARVVSRAIYKFRASSLLDCSCAQMLSRCAVMKGLAPASRGALVCFIYMQLHVWPAPWR
mgnify:CR=1 FL=1